MSQCHLHVLLAIGKTCFSYGRCLFFYPLYFFYSLLCFILRECIKNDFSSNTGLPWNWILLNMAFDLVFSGNGNLFHVGNDHYYWWYFSFESSEHLFLFYYIKLRHNKCTLKYICSLQHVHYVLFLKKSSFKKDRFNLVFNLK